MLGKVRPVTVSLLNVRALQTNNTIGMRSGATRGPEDGVPFYARERERYKAPTKEEVNNSSTQQHEVLQSFFRSLLMNKQRSGTENKDMSSPSSVLDPELRRTVESSTPIRHDAHRVWSSSGSPTEMCGSDPRSAFPDPWPFSSPQNITTVGDTRESDEPASYLYLSESPSSNAHSPVDPNSESHLQHSHYDPSPQATPSCDSYVKAMCTDISGKRSRIRWKRRSFIDDTRLGSPKTPIIPSTIREPGSNLALLDDCHISTGELFSSLALVLT